MHNKIRKALGLLNSENDDQWTMEGLPRLDVMGKLIGDAASRAEITAAAPDFRRDNMVIYPTDIPAEEIVEQPDDIIEKEFKDAKANLVAAQSRYRDAVAAMDVVIAKREKLNKKRPLALDIQAYQRSQAEQRAKSAANVKAMAESLAAMKQAGM
jgi:hypothetical protein